MAPPKSPKKAVASLTLSALSKTLGSKLPENVFDYLKGLSKVQRDAILSQVKSGAFNTKTGKVSLSQVKTAVGKLDTSKLIESASKTKKTASAALKKTQKTKPKTDNKPKDPPKDTTYNINTVKGLKEVKEGGRSAGNKALLALGTAGTGTALTYGAMTAADKLKVGSSEAKADDLKRTSAKMKDKAGEPIAKPRSTEKKKLAGDELGPSAGAKTTGPKKETKKDSKATYTPRKGKKKPEPKESLKDQFFKQDKRKYGPFTVDSTDRGMSKYGDSDNWKELEAEEEMNLRKGGTARRKAFGKGGMYKTPKKAYGMRKGGFTRRGASR